MGVQFAFLAFLLGQSLEGFGQWKALLRMLLSCEEAPLRTRTPLHVRFLAAVRAQLQHCLASGRCAADWQSVIPQGGSWRSGSTAMPRVAKASQEGVLPAGGLPRNSPARWGCQ